MGATPGLPLERTGRRKLLRRSFQSKFLDAGTLGPPNRIVWIQEGLDYLTKSSRAEIPVTQTECLDRGGFGHLPKQLGQ